MRQTELLELICVTELVIVPAAQSIVKGSSQVPVLADAVCQAEMRPVLPEVVGCLGPRGSVGHLVALGCPSPRPVGLEILPQVVVASQSRLIHILIGLYAVVGIERVVSIAGRHAVPGLTRMLVVADVLV